MGFRRMLLAASLVAVGMIGASASSAAAKPIATNDVPGASYSIGSSLATVESDTTSWMADYPTKSYVPPFGAGHFASIEASVSYAGSLGGIDISAVDYYRKAGPLTSEVSQSYKVGPLIGSSI